LRILFEYPVLSDMAVWLDQQQPGSYLPPIVPQPEDQPRLMSYHQERILFLDQLEGPAATYNTPATLKLTGKLDFPALKQTFILLIERHQSLRLAFDLVNNKPRLREIPVYNPITEIDLSPLPKEQQQTEIEHLVQSHAGKPFVLSRGQLIQLQLLRLSDQENLLLVNMHHIIADGWSLGVLIREWMQIYSSLRQGDIPKLTPLPLQYTDFVAWQRNCVQNNLLQQQQEYWSKQLNGAPTFLRLSTDFPRPEVPSHHGSHLKYYISPELTRQIKEFNKKQGCTLFMTLLAIFNVLLHHYSDQDDILVGCPIANRKNRQTEDIFGLFVNILLFRTQIKEQNTFVDLIKQVRQTAIGAYAHQDLPFELLLQQLNHEQSPSHNPLFQVMFVLQNNEVPELKLPSLEIQTIEQTSSRAKFDLTLYVTEIDDYLELNWNYATDLFQAERIQNMAEHFATLLQSLTQQPKTDIYRLSL
ncbi:non-ribosomal peptide synthetase, partial [bacterium]|nr:non-ribosomal peptide synthetase [bacterium]